MDSRDDWPDEILEGDLGAVSEVDPEERLSAARIARDMRNMNAVLAAMAERVGEGLPDVADRQVVPLRRRFARGRRVLVPLAAAAAVAALILIRGDEVEEGGVRLVAAASSMVSEMDVEADMPFAVFPTSDPNIAVVWLLNLEESE
ncbi:MAG: hypothetical protein F4Z50_08790 [Gemmatimonadetes bacterium]|nr:hypothetical protein [Gemmatimonadota bacterium]MYD12438.1 hypothetical protein [Gemmatimonadota bacterium]